MLLKISTATTVTIGPVLDADGAAVTTAVVTNFSLVKNGSSAALTTETLTHVANGYYALALTSGNTNTLGNLEVFVNNTAMSMTVFRYNVIAAQVYDSIVSGTDLLQTDVREMLADVITSSTLATSAVDEIVDGVWDEVLTGATHNIASSAGRRLRQLASVIVRAGTAQGPGTGNNQIQLDAGASSINGDYDPGLIFIETGTGAGQARLILQYDGSTKVATVDRDWRVNPDNTSEFVILADAGRESVNEGLAQAATSTTITLNVNASSNDDAYNGQLIFIRSGTGQDQIALVEDYVGSTKVATIRTRSSNGQWSVTPDTTSAYVMIPNLTWTISEMQAGLATSSGVTSAFTEIKGATWSSSTDTLEAIRDAVDSSGGGGDSIIVTPIVAQTPVRTVASNISTFKGDRSAITVGVFDELDPVDLTALGALEVCIQTKAGTDLQVIANANITISGADNNYFSFSPGSAAVATVGRFMWSLRVAASNSKRVIAYGAWIVEDAALNDA